MIKVSDGHENLLLGVLKPNLQDLWPSLNLFVSGNQAKFQVRLVRNVGFKAVPTLFQFIALEHFLSETLGVKVDLVMKDSLKPDLRELILAEAQEV